MTVQLSPHKVSKILRGYFRGLPQTKIAKEAGVDQSSISHYANRFKGMAAEYGLLAERFWIAGSGPNILALQELDQLVPVQRETVDLDNVLIVNV